MVLLTLLPAKLQSLTLQDEAFELWTSEWGALYEKGSRSNQIIEEIASTWYLVSVVDNDYVNGDLFGLLTSEKIPAAPSSNGNHAAKA
jgi:hypothetical protein